MIDLHIVNDGNGNVGWEVRSDQSLADTFATYIVATKGLLKDITLQHARQGLCKSDCMLESDMLQVLTVLKRIETNHMKGGDNDMDDATHLNTEPNASDAQAPAAEPAAEPQVEPAAAEPQAEPAANEPAEAGEKADEPTSGQEAGQE